MPNQRKKGKVMIGGFIPKEIADALKEEAKNRGMTVKDLLEEIIRNSLKKEDANEEE